MSVSRIVGHSMVLVAIVAVTLTAGSNTSLGGVLHFEGFEDPSWSPGGNNWNDFSGATISRVSSNTGGISSSSGVAHGSLTTGNGPFTRFGGYRTDFGLGFTASLDIYLDTGWTEGTGFDYSVAASRQNGDHLRDFIFHVGVDGNDLLVNASNNSDFGFNAFKLQNNNSGNNFTVSDSGWYTFEHVFYDDAGSLSVDMSLLDTGGNSLYTITRSNLNDDIATTVGGNRYGWFVFNDIDGLAIDNTQLTSNSVVPEPSSIAIFGLGLLGAATRLRRRKPAKA